MIIVKVCSGLGNQLFQYALYLKLKLMGFDVKIDCRECFEGADEGRPFMLDALALPYDLANKKELNHYAGKNDIWEKLAKRFFNYQKKTIYKEKGNSIFDGNVFSLDGRYLLGYWQSEKYFKDIRDELIDIIRFPEISDDFNIDVLKRILSSEAVSIHVRRGDYLLPAYKSRFAGICDVKYYEKSMDYMRKNIVNPKFFVFSDDVEWCRDFFKDYNDVEIVDCNDNYTSYNDMNLMHQCKHNIISNSSFSWWGAWLNNNINQIVIAPRRWLNGEDTPDIWCEGWIKM